MTVRASPETYFSTRRLVEQEEPTGQAPIFFFGGLTSDTKFMVLGLIALVGVIGLLIYAVSRK